MMYAQHFITAAEMFEWIVREDLVETVIVLYELSESGL